MKQLDGTFTQSANLLLNPFLNQDMLNLIPIIILNEPKRN